MSSTDNPKEPSSVRQETFPELQAAVDALRQRISLTESEIVPLAEIIDAKRKLIFEWKRTANTLVPGSYPDPLDFRRFQTMFKNFLTKETTDGAGNVPRG